MKNKLTYESYKAVTLLNF